MGCNLYMYECFYNQELVQFVVHDMFMCNSCMEDVIHSDDICINLSNHSADINAPVILLCHVYAKEVPWIVLMTTHELSHSRSAVLFQ